MPNSYESVIPEFRLNELCLLVTSEGFTLEDASKELRQDVDSEMLSDFDDDDDVIATPYHYAVGEAEVINDDGFIEQLRYLYDCNDFAIVKTLVLAAVENLKSQVGKA